MCLDRDGASDRANMLDSMRKTGKAIGPLHGVPVGIKDIVDTVNLPTSFGSSIFTDRKPASSARIIELLEMAGAIVVGKTVTTEFAFMNPSVTKNPINKAYSPGGSSSGSASIVAAGIIPVSLGSDTGGSVRLPASACGLFGIKPTQGLISRDGVFPLSISLDSVGPLSRTVYDVATILQILAVHDDNDHLSVNVKVPNYISEMKRGIKGIKIGLPKNYFLEGNGK